MSSSKKRYSERVPWEPTALRLANHIGRVNELYLHREESGATWWSEGCALFRGTAPTHLREAYLSAGLPIAAPMNRLTIAVIEAARNTPKTAALGDPIASYEATGGVSAAAPVDVFAADADAPEIHVDARYITHARRTFPLCTFWRDNTGDFVLERDRAGALAGIIQRRRRPDEPRPQRRRGAA